MYTFYFEKLEVWQNARQLTKIVYEITSGFPNNESFGLVSQLRRASSSIGTNIAEGVHRNTQLDKARFMNIAYGSTMEVLNFLILSLDLGYIEETKYSLLREKVELVANQLNAFTKRLQDKN